MTASKMKAGKRPSAFVFFFGGWVVSLKGPAHGGPDKNQ